MAFVITSACVDVMDRSCIEECPVDCIHDGVRMLYIDPIECIDCGACEPVCPHDAVYRDEELPSELAEFVTINAEFFSGDGIGPAVDGGGPVDHPLVAAAGTST
jgi:NAD-dependent dihydropyrimidine dehydrogenase PreA subunit